MGSRMNEAAHIKRFFFPPHRICLIAIHFPVPTDADVIHHTYRTNNNVNMRDPGEQNERQFHADVQIKDKRGGGAREEARDQRQCIGS